MSVERIRDGLLQCLARHRRARQTFQQHLALVEEAGGAVTALEGEMVDEGLLQHRELAVPSVPLDGADRLAVKIHGGRDAGRGGGAGAVGRIDDDGAAQALRGAAAELGAGHAEYLAQKIVHRKIVANVHRTVLAAVDGQAEGRHASTPFNRLAVTGNARKRWPVASWMALISAGTIGIMTTSAMPLGASSAVCGFSISISRSRKGRSEPRATR